MEDIEKLTCTPELKACVKSCFDLMRHHFPSPPRVSLEGSCPVLSFISGKRWLRVYPNINQIQYDLHLYDLELEGEIETPASVNPNKLRSKLKYLLNLVLVEDDFVEY